MSDVTQLIEDNLRYLEQARDLIEYLSDEAFAGLPSTGYGSPTGAHFRHCLDHYENFLQGAAAGRIDYDTRQRDRAVETSREAALSKVDDLMLRLQAMAGQPDAPVQTKMDCGNEADTDIWWTDSSLRRELQFLISHTVHHYAIIKMTLNSLGEVTGPDFGMAPSTLRYHQGLSACVH